MPAVQGPTPGLLSHTHPQAASLHSDRDLPQADHSLASRLLVVIHIMGILCLNTDTQGYTGYKETTRGHSVDLDLVDPESQLFTVCPPCP